MAIPVDDRRVRAFGAAVRSRREELGLSQEALGYRAGLHRTFISDIERGRRNPTVKVIWKLARALDTGPSALFAQAETFEAKSLKDPRG